MRAFSVALNAFNREGYVAQTLEAILAQSHPPEEIIVVDDGSTDGTADVVRTFAPDVTLISSENEGPGLSRHKAVSACSRDWIATCDSDDVWKPNHLLVLDEAMSAFPDAVMACTNSTRFRDDVEDGYDHFAAIGDAWWQKSSSETMGSARYIGRDPYLHLLEANPVYVSCQAFSKAAYTAIGGPPAALNRINSEDADVTRRFALHGPLVADEQVTVAIRKHPENFSVSNAANFIGKARILQHHLDAKLVPQKWCEAVEDERERVLLQAFRNAYWENDAARASEALGLRATPSLDWRDRLRLVKVRLTGHRRA